MSIKVPKMVKVRWIIHNGVFLAVVILLSLFEASNCRPYFKFNKQIPMEIVYEQIYYTSCKISEEALGTIGYFGGYLVFGIPPTLKKICIEIEENGQVEGIMRESNMEISLEDPLKSAQYIWTISRMKFHIFITEPESYLIWLSVLRDLKLVDDLELESYDYLPEYRQIISSRPVVPGKQVPLRRYPNMDDLLVMLTITSQVYKLGKFATDFTGGNFLLFSKEIKKRTTPLIYSNVEYYLPILTKLYPPSFEYQNLLSSVSFVYRMIYYCTGNIIFPKEAWEMWGLINSFGGGGYIPKFDKNYEEAILTQDNEDVFPEERSFFVVLERLIELQDPSWDIVFPPMYGHRKNNKGGLEDHELFKFMEFKGISIPNKHSKDTDGIMGVYLIFHYVLKVFIPITTARDLWVIIKTWLSYPTDYVISDNVSFVQYGRHITKRWFKDLDPGKAKDIPKWASGNQSIDVYSETFSTFISEFEHEFPYIITCPDGELVLKDKSDNQYKNISQNAQRVDRIAISIAKEVHTLFPNIKFSKICELASSFSLIIPFNFQLHSKFKIVREKKKASKTTSSKDNWKFEDNLEGIEYCRKGILNLLKGGDISLDQYDEYYSIRIIKHLDSACLKIIKAHVKCEIKTPYYLPYQVSNTINTFAGNLANVLSSSFMGDTNYYKQVIGTIWDGRLQSLVQEDKTPSLFRLHNPGFNPEKFCIISEKFVIPAIVGYFAKKNLARKKKFEKNMKWKKIIKRIKERYYGKNKKCEHLDYFFEDLRLLKDILKSHKIPKGANINDWKDFVLDEESISSFILGQLSKSSDFKSVCKTYLERELRSGNIQFFPISTESNKYREYLLNRIKKTNLFFKTLVKDDNSNIDLRDISKLLMFKDESLLEFPETIASNIKNQIYYDKFNLEFKNLIQWYINDSCENASSLVYKGVKPRWKMNYFCCCSKCYRFMGNKSGDSVCTTNKDSKMNLNLVEEALEYGLKVIMNNPNINLFITSTFNNQLSVMEEFGIFINTDLFDKNFIINNANFLYMCLSHMNVPITRNMALLSSEIASKLIKNYFMQGELLVHDRIATLKSDNVDVSNVGNPSFLKIPLDPRSISKIRIYCEKSEYNEMAVSLLEITSSTGGFKDSFDKSFLQWNSGYIDFKKACEIVKDLADNGITKFEGDYYRIKQSKLCLDFMSSKYSSMPQIAIPVCMSQHLMIECGTGNYLDDVFASIIAINNYKYGVADYFDVYKEYVCFLSKTLTTVYQTPNFTERCKEMLTEIFGFTIFAERKFKNLNSREVNLLLDDICNDVNLMHTCDNFSSNQKITSEIKRASDIIISEITNEFTDFDFYWRKDIMCKAASKFVRLEFEDCKNTVKLILKNIDFKFPKSFHSIICSKINIWPRTCPVEKFSNHSIFSNMFYRYVVIPMFNDDLLKHQKKVNEIVFDDICDILEKYHSIENYKSSNPVLSTIGIDPVELCTSYFEELFPSKELYEENLGIQIIKMRKECETAVSSYVVSIIKDKSIFSFFDSSSKLDFGNFPYLPGYMQSGELADTLINKYKLPPRVTLLTIGLSHALDELNSRSKVKYEFSTLGLVYNSVNMVRIIDDSSVEKFLLECMNINKKRIFPVIENAELGEVCKGVMLSFENRELSENIYLMYSLNSKVSSYYSTHFTSENISYISKSYVSRVLRGKPSLSLQKVYEKVLNEYIDYMFSGFNSYIPDRINSDNGHSIYKRLNTKHTESNKPNKEQDGENIANDDLNIFLKIYLYKADVKEKQKDKLNRALMMFNFLLETKRMGVFQIHNSNIHSFEISQEISPNLILQFLPPDFANWLLSYENYMFVSRLFIVPIYSEENKAIGQIADLDAENNLLYNKLSSNGIALNRVMNILEDKQKMISGDKKIEISAIILESTLKYIIEEYSTKSATSYASSVANNSYLFKHMARRLTLNKEVLFGLRHNITPTKLFINTNYIAFEAIRHFIENHPSEIRSRTDFILNKFDFANNIHQDSSFYYDGDINSEEMKHVRNRFFCQSFNKQIMRKIDDRGSNPFFECYYFRVKDFVIYRESRYIEGKTVRNCEFTGKLTRAKTIEEKYTLLKSYLRFLLNDNESYFPFVSDSLRLFPETILQGIGRIYGYCLLIGEPLNFYFANFIFRYIKTGNPNNESNIVDYFDKRLNQFKEMINAGFGTLDSKKFSTIKMDFKSAKKKTFKEPIYYHINQREFEDEKFNPSLKLKNSGLFEVNNFNNLRFLRKNISRFIGYEKFKTEIDFFVKGVYDIVPRRFLRSFFDCNMYYFTQGYIQIVIRNETLIKSIIQTYFYVENELLLPHKRVLIKWFYIALNTLTFTDIGYFFATFTGRFTIFLPTAYVGRVRIVDIPLNEEKNPENRIIIDPLLMIVYIPNYKTYIEVEKSILRIIEMNKRTLNYST